MGIFCREDNSFKISRENSRPTYVIKNGCWVLDGPTYLTKEFHWDTGEPFGTAKPLVKLGPTNLSFMPQMNDQETLKFLNQMSEMYKTDIDEAHRKL
ncbi:MAG: hypothetical protein PHF86_06455 [Candidatus Nanoarchaeia archaeon]|nr:hypothetical protein [Candidatus Nanoarchaeia archaeon]